MKTKFNINTYYVYKSYFINKTVVNHLRYALFPKDNAVTSSIIEGWQYHDYLFTFLEKNNIKTYGKDIIDVGANNGSFSIDFSHLVGDEGKVHSFYNYEHNFITEKLWEPILCETLCFYYGCHNVSDYINSQAYVQLDMNDFSKSYEIIKNAIKEDLWSKRIDKIKEEKLKLLNEMQFYPRLENMINKINNKL